VHRFQAQLVEDARDGERQVSRRVAEALGLAGRFAVARQVDGDDVPLGR